ncbi:MAG: RNA polymerase sporulation sigma factor SigH [Eubacteriales bacterium]|nr:RNA polymerase sporulation sigma factor SigH [Eubacteriales bacterium]MDD4389606.1 RNA polymerase sporulation sigma factor SigH [Eubacteriales bacterium]
MNEYETMPDEELVEKAQGGDINAQEAIISRYRHMVKSKARMFFIVGADSEDVVQEGMIGIFKAVRDYRPDKNASFKTFAELCISRQIITAVQGATRKKHSPLNQSVSLSSPTHERNNKETLEMTVTAPQAENPEEVTIMRESIGNIFINASTIFSEFEKEVWRMHLQGKNYLKIAKEMGKSSKSIDNALQRISKKITSFLDL